MPCTNLTDNSDIPDTSRECLPQGIMLGGAAKCTRYLKGMLASRYYAWGCCKIEHSQIKSSTDGLLDTCTVV